MFGFRTYIRLTQTSPQGRQQSLSLEMNPVDNAEQCCLANRLSQAWVHFVTDRASLLTDHRMSGLPIRAKYKHVNTIFEQSFWQLVLQSIQDLPNWIDDHPSKLYFTAPLSCLPVHSIAQRIFEHVPPCRRTTRPSLREVSPTLVIFQLLQQKYVIQTS